MLYNPVEPYASGWLKTEEPHEIYWECSGNPKGKPILFIHGGPGSHTKPDHRRLFDPKLWRIILFDQRGCGKSLPLGSLQNNSTFKLIEDMEALRRHLKIDRWALYGTSWGAALAICYALQHTQAIASLLLRGAFTGEPSDVAKEFYPQEWSDYLNYLPTSERSDPLKAYAKRIHAGDKEASYNYTRWFLTLLRMDLQMEMIEAQLKEQDLIPSARIETHYALERYFLKPRWILENAHRIKQPTLLVHGRYDLVCPLSGAYQLHRAIKGSQLIVVQAAGHATSEHAMEEAVVSALNTLFRVTP